MKWLTAILLSVGLMVSQPAMADQWTRQLGPGDIRTDVQKGKIVKLKKIHKSLKKEFGGFHVTTELFSRDDSSGLSDYHIQWVTDDGKKTLFIIDAQTGEILSNAPTETDDTSEPE